MVFSYILILVFSVQLLQISESATVVVDGVSEWKNPELQIGDCVIFQHKYHYSLYIFKNQEAFSLCNFTQATILTNPNSSVYTWRTSRPGFFYFSFYNGSNQACLEGEKLAVKVTSAAAAPTPPPTSGGYVASSPAFPWPFQPRDGAPPPSAAPGPVAPEREGIPFINSNPAVPLPTGEVDSATIRPLPTSAHQQSKQVLGVERAVSCVILLLMMV
ncbi:early nodulin-like protein 14 [Salvia miltiorrhiza]|uniref:early nodulin-like protein 14 n=1 Tax=Salvia miltiorrhiza TaxID=226208 RepID=UPI0025AD2361|nr:early nodulin-like protein 14 [Salvia miltiorrhiza]